MDLWNDAAWDSLVDAEFNLGDAELAAVRWYVGEHRRELVADPLCPDLDAGQSRFCGVTDELSNVLLSHAMGSNLARYEKLHRFVELLRTPGANGLQCWKYYVNGAGVYDDHTDLCVVSDSASDASIRILGAYGIACAKQQSGIWQPQESDFCGDYLRQGNAVWGRGTASHGEIKLLANGEYYLANGYNNQPGAPTNTRAFRPDYYELQFLMDFAKYEQSDEMRQGVVDMLADYRVSMGDNRIHAGKTGHFNSTTTAFFCDELCSPPYMDAIDTWRAVPALSGLLNAHPGEIDEDLKAEIFDYWWDNYSGGHPTLYAPTDAKPFEIFANRADGIVRLEEESYKTLAMWIPLAVAYDPSYVRQAVDFLVDEKYDQPGRRFYGADYFGGYFSQFAQRAIGAATGMIDPAFWAGSAAERCIYFAQFGDGRSGATTLFSRLTLLNPSRAVEAPVQVALRRSDGGFLSVDLNGANVDGLLQTVVPPEGVRSFSTDGLGPLTSGSVTACSSNPIDGVVLFGGTAGLAGVEDGGRLTAGFLAPMEVVTAQGVNTGVAIMNTEAAPVAVRLFLLDPDGAELASQEIALEALGQRADFVDVLFEESSVDFSEFVGSLKAVPIGGAIAATVIQTRPGQFATIPVSPLVP